ncbi:hypothetical protein KAR91_27370 [Candidatus Pacearchaeota archaeon]|nr:hypothetical protein [Candidatus Pacearchaeota archaeon]
MLSGKIVDVNGRLFKPDLMSRAWEQATFRNVEKLQRAADVANSQIHLSPSVRDKMPERKSIRIGRLLLSCSRCGAPAKSPCKPGCEIGSLDA